MYTGTSWSLQEVKKKTQEVDDVKLKKTEYDWRSQTRHNECIRIGKKATVKKEMK